MHAGNQTREPTKMLRIRFTLFPSYALITDLLQTSMENII